MKQLLLPVISWALFLYALIGTASAEWIPQVIQTSSPINEALSTVMLGLTLVGLSVFIRKSSDRRLGIERRQYAYTGYLPERRSGRDRRMSPERRNGDDRRK
ncbi:MAG: hypothetical protein PVH30_13710 [Desulfobacterales bacterium]